MPVRTTIPSATNTAKRWLFIVILLGLPAGILIFIALQRFQTGVPPYMERLQLEATGSTEFIAPAELHLREAQLSYKAGDYEAAYDFYKAAYRSGSTDSLIYRGLRDTTRKLCAEKQQYCEEVGEWEKVVVRLNDDHRS